MSDLETYLAFAKRHPALFANPQGGFTILLDENKIREVEAQMARKLEEQDLPSAWSKVGIVYQDQYLLLLRDAVRFPDGSLGTYIRFVEEDDHAPGVVILPYHRGHILLVRHFRHATRTWHLEIPRGFGTGGHSSEENARRELEEEIQASISRLVALGRTYPDTGASAEYIDLFFAEVASYGQGETQEGISEILPVTIAEFEQMIRDGALTDGFTTTTYAYAKIQGLL